MATALHVPPAHSWNFCPRHLSSELTSDGKCLGCVVERERQNNYWWVESVHYGTLVPSSDLWGEASVVMFNESKRRSLIHKNGCEKRWRSSRAGAGGRRLQAPPASPRGKA